MWFVSMWKSRYLLNFRLEVGELCVIDCRIGNTDTLNDVN